MPRAKAHILTHAYYLRHTLVIHESLRTCDLKGVGRSQCFVLSFLKRPLGRKISICRIFCCIQKYKPKKNQAYHEMFCCTCWIAKGEKFINLVIAHTILSVATTCVWEIRIDRTQFSQWMCDIGLNVKGSVHYHYSLCVSNVITLNNYFLHTNERVTLPKTQGENFFCGHHVVVIRRRD